MAVSLHQAEYTKEVRFAVVMYGGVSLAIYINGIAQELLRLVRATAKDRQTDGASPPSGTERIYRMVSYLLANETNGLAPSEADLNDPKLVPPTRFVVDILSGTSAGGINGIFLAKALANGQDIEQLKDLWVQEGDIDTLINDKKSVEKPLTLQDPPTSLLNGERMYLELLKAFDGMDKASGKRDEDALSPYIDELDLFVTSTDLQGVVLPIRLSDDWVYERRHRNVLHFVYSTPAMSGEEKPRNDFLAKYNPFLAYAARCTSSFPFAFEPMCLCDTDKILNKLGAYHGDEKCKSGSNLWRKFYRDYLDPRGVSTVPFPRRAFGDGGYLDNKPFSYATETLMNRNADVPVDRKLIYIEPSPEHPEDEVEREEKPDAIDNVMSALLTLPRHETIREDLQRVLERNSLIERVNRITAGVDRDYRWLQAGAFAGTSGDGLWAVWGLPEEQISQLDLADMARRNGRSYAAYHRLRIASVTDDLAKLVARVAGFDENSGYFTVIRNLVYAWREKTYVEYRSSDNADKPTMNGFLFHFDLAYPLRRINYLRRKIDVFYRLEAEALEFMEPLFPAWGVERLGDSEKTIFRQELLRSKKVLNDAFVMLRRVARSLRSRPIAMEKPDAKQENRFDVREQVMNLFDEINRVIKNEFRDKESDSPLLDYFLGKRESEQVDQVNDPIQLRLERLEYDPRQRAAMFLDQHSRVLDLFSATAETLRAGVIAAKKDVEKHLLNLKDSTADDGADRVALLARDCVTHYYHNYEAYDVITYPILYDTNVGEADMIEIIRVSPEDAKQLIDERETGCHKLAGTALGHFGAFLEKLWRQNDILWGRLDGAERIITSLIPNHPLRTQLIGEAQAEIICETIGAMGEDERHRLLAESLMRTRTRKAEPELLDNFVKNLTRNSVNNPALSNKLKNLINKTKLRQFYVKNFGARSHVEPETALRSAARATTVVGKMLADLSSSRRVSSKYAAWIARLGQIFWALVEVAVPRSFPNLFFRHWLKLVYFLEALLIAGSTLLLAADVQRFALTAFGITVAIHLVVVILGDLMQTRNRLINLGKVLGGALLIALIAVGALTLSAILGVNFSWKAILKVRTWLLSSAPFGWNSKTYARVALFMFFFLPFLWAIRGDLKAIFRNPNKK